MRVGRLTFCLRLLTLFLDKRKSGKFSIFVKKPADSRCQCGYVYFHGAQARECMCIGSIYYLREASACLLVQRRWAIPEPPFVERATGMALTHFFCNSRFVSRLTAISICYVLDGTAYDSALRRCNLYQIRFLPKPCCFRC